MQNFFKCSLLIYSWFIFVALGLSSCSSSKEAVVPKPPSPNDVNQNFIYNLGSEERPLSSFEATGFQAMAASESEPISRAAIDVLHRGGNAIDAAIAASFVASVYRPHSSGLGGGGFLLFYQKKSKSFNFLDMRERAPLEATQKFYASLFADGLDRSRADARFVAVPGLLKGLYAAYEKFGSGNISWKELVEPARVLAQSGYQVYPQLASAISFAASKGIIDRAPQTKELLTGDSGDYLAVGDYLQLPDLAKTLAIIGNKGISSFYQGAIANEIVKSVRAKDGLLKLHDLEFYKEKWRKPLIGSYRGYQLALPPLPSSGGIALLEMLNTLEQYNLSKYKLGTIAGVGLSLAAMDRAFSDRARYLGDPDYSYIPVEWLTSKAYARARSADLTAAGPYRNNPPGSDSSDEPFATSTTHFSIVDVDGNVVASTQSINHYFGAGFIAGKTGIFMNNHMDDFVLSTNVENGFGLTGEQPNFVEGGKRPLSSMSPIIVMKNGSFFLTLGSPGGPRIINAVFQVLRNVIDYQMPLLQAVSASRVHFQVTPDTVFIESDGLALDTQDELERRGFKIAESKYGIGNVSAIKRNEKNNTLVGVSDPRYEGVPIGY